jgi:hypothetical protein
MQHCRNNSKNQLRKQAKWIPLTQTYMASHIKLNMEPYEKKLD